MQVPLLAVLAFCTSACQQAPLKPEHGYPTDWPALTALSKGCAELNGTYKNEGTIFHEDGGFAPIKLESLIPRLETRDHPKEVVPSLPCGDCIRIRMLPATSWKPYPGMRVTLPGPDHTRLYDVDTASEQNALLYVLESSSGGFVVSLAGEQNRVFLTVADDGSLIAKIHHDMAGMVLLIPFWSNKYAWARFERIED